ncbi:MAG: T9SS C-terminal target domain-containing protein, partial [Prevotella sp.]|nr:T9SS C-terminal target domain-containing protein [Prevotella sp.]
WRVDEIDASGNVTKGNIWKFKPRQLAFNGAEGYGRFAQGGRGGVVYHVTSLSNENVPGTLYYGLKNTEMGPRTIVFDVSGIIDFGFEAIFIQPYVTLAGQTAPGKGICIKGSNINIGSDNICRHMRFKHGYGDTGNSMGLSGSNHTIVDHTTAAWGTDETVSGRGAKNISFQYSMIAEALGIADHKNYGEGTNHGYAATIDGKVGSWHHNLLLNCAGRNWSMGGGMDGENRPIGQLDLFNNVVYNWNSRTTDGNAHEVNFVGNYYKMGPDTGNKILFSQDFEAAINPEGTNKAYISGNIRENKDGSLTTDAKNVTYRVRATNGGTIPTTYETIVNEPLFPSYATIHTAQDAFKIVTSEAGATMPMRDDQHLRVVDETIDGTYTYVGSRSGIKGEIDHENDCGGWEVYPEESRATDFDTDQDGMPDWYEKLAGTNPAAADNNNDPDMNGWTALEDYLEFMAHPYIIVSPSTQTTFDAAPWFRGFKKTSPEYSIATGSDLFTASVSGSVINVNTNGNGGIGIITMKVKDNAGTTHEKRLSVAVIGETTGINNVWSEENIDVAKREFFTLDGKQATTFRQNDIYIMKVTDKNGKVYTMKAIRK